MRTLVLLAALASPAVAQSVIFHEGFESGLAGWTATGLWHALSDADPCGATVAPLPEGSGVAYYGIDGACNYDTGALANSGELTQNDWIDLPAGATSISLHYWSWNETEYCWDGWDVHSLFVDVQTPSSTFYVPFCDGSVATSVLLPWHERRADLTSLAGHRVRLRFGFRTVDDAANLYRGWFLDDISIVVEPGIRICPSTGLQSGCPCAQPYVPVAGGCRNSTGQSAVLYSMGSTSVTSDTLQLRVEHMPPNASAILTQATASVGPTAFGDGIRCIGGEIRRMGALAATAGVGIWPPSGTDPISARGAVPATGGTRYYYVYYRDVLPYCTSAPFNLTDTQRIVWMP